MKHYTEPKLEIVTFKASDVITASVAGTQFFNLFKTTGIEDGGRASLNNFQISTGNQ